MTPEDQDKVNAVTAALLPEHRQWLENFAGEHDLSFDALIRGARDWVENDEHTYIGVDIDYEAMSETFWEHYVGYTSENVPEDKRGNFFSCAC